MIEPVQVLWSPAGTSMPSLGDRALVDVTDGDTPNIRTPIRMLSVDTPEVIGRTPRPVRPPLTGSSPSWPSGSTRARPRSPPASPHTCIPSW